MLLFSSTFEYFSLTLFLTNTYPASIANNVAMVINPKKAQEKDDIQK